MLVGIVGCNFSKPDVPQGSVVYELESIEPNDINVSKDSIDVFSFSLKADDNTYLVSFKARGMPVYINEEGNYEIKGSKISFSKTSGSNIFSEGLGYNSKDGTITVACFKSGSADTYTAVFRINKDG